MTWGVLQYHFGDKDRLLQAVLDHIFNDFLETLENALEVSLQTLENSANSSSLGAA